MYHCLSGFNYLCLNHASLNQLGVTRIDVAAVLQQRRIDVRFVNQKMLNAQSIFNQKESIVEKQKTAFLMNKPLSQIRRI